MAEPLRRTVSFYVPRMEASPTFPVAAVTHPLLDFRHGTVFQDILKLWHKFIHTHDVYVFAEGARPDEYARVTEVFLNPDQTQSALSIVVEPPQWIQELFAQFPRPGCLDGVSNTEEVLMHLATFGRLALGRQMTTLDGSIRVLDKLQCQIRWHYASATLNTGSLDKVIVPMTRLFPPCVWKPIDLHQLQQYLVLMTHLARDPLFVYVFFASPITGYFQGPEAKIQQVKKPESAEPRPKRIVEVVVEYEPCILTSKTSKPRNVVKRRRYGLRKRQTIVVRKGKLLF